MTTAVIPCYANTRACVDPNNTWMMPFVTPGLVTGTPTALDPSISPLKVKVEEAVCWWWRWKKLKLKIYDLVEGFGNQEIELFRYVEPFSIFGGNTLCDSERLLAKPESNIYYGDLLINTGAPDFDTLAISAKVQILPPEGTGYGDDLFPSDGDFHGGVVGDAYQIQDIPRGSGIMSPSTCDCVPIVIIDINIEVMAGTDYRSRLTNYGPADETFSGEFGGVYGGVVGDVINQHGITLNSSGVTSCFLPGATTVAKILPIEWFDWNGTWNTDTGERL